MKALSKNAKQNTLTNFFNVVPKSLSLKDHSNALNIPGQNHFKCDINTDHDKSNLTKSFTKEAPKKNKSPKRKRENDENASYLLSKTEMSQSPFKHSPKRAKQNKTLVEDISFSDVGDEFFEDFPIIEKEFFERNLNLKNLERYRVDNVEITAGNDIKLTVQSLENQNNNGVCIVKSPWNACAVSTGNVISLQGRLDESTDIPCWVVDWNGGLLVTNADHLLSGTTIVSSLQCSRRTVLSQLFKPQEVSSKSSSAMFVGCVVHELLQETLTTKRTTLKQIEELFNKKTNSTEFKVNLFLENCDPTETVEDIFHFIPRIYNFVHDYVRNGKFQVQEPIKKKDWQGCITSVSDIEENIWSHKLGIKGKVDATVQVQVQNKIKTVPLELKTGKGSPLNLEHRGQVILYCMLLQEMGANVDFGLLLYLRDEERVIDVKFGEKERRDLILLRNGLSGWLKNLKLVDSGENILPPPLPKVINRNTCQWCPQLLACSSALRLTGEIDLLEENHYLKNEASLNTNHLSDEHLKYVFYWLGVLSLEFEKSKFCVSRIWSYKPEDRESKGWCISRMKLSSSSIEGRSWKIVFVKMNNSPINCSFDKGQPVIIGNHVNIAAATGSIVEIKSDSVIVKSDKELKDITPPIYIDAYESSSINNILMNNLGILLYNTPAADSLRKSIIDQKLPNFSTKLSSKIKHIGHDIFNRLNKEQIRAVLQAISAEKYILIKGMPGAGKTSTMRALIELLVRMGSRIMVTSFTHSAIDNILLGLPFLEAGNVLRIGPTRRIHPKVAQYASEDKILQDLGANVTPENLNKAYQNKKIVGVTCLGCGQPWVARQKFDICLVDEATQVTQPAVLKPLSLADKFILVGDPKQLPPLVLCNKAKKYGLAVSLFEKLDRPAVTSCLTLQYRMNAYITKIANEFVYDGQLKCGTEQVAQNVLSYSIQEDTKWPEWLKLALDKELEKSVIVIDVVDRSQSNNEILDNKTEANVISKIIKALHQVRIDLSTVGVIAAYRDQVTLLRDLLATEVEINTVDQYQGRDKEVILFSTTKSSEHVAYKDILNDMNRLNVAITRAKKKLIIIGNVTLLKNYPNFSKLLTLIPGNNFVTFNS